jgi:hypothetical protein
VIKTKEVIKKYLKFLLYPKKITDAITGIDGVIIRRTMPNAIILIGLGEEVTTTIVKYNAYIELIYGLNPTN